MNRFLKLLSIAVLCACAFSSCRDIEEYPDDPFGNFDALWSIVDTHYCFFAEKDVDWKSIGEEYRAKIVPGITLAEYFDICGDMLSELRDGHVNLIAPFNVSYYRRWWTDYPQDFNLRTLQQYYLDFNYMTTGGIIYKILPGKVGYMRYSSFSAPVSDGNLDYVLSWFADCDALIIDIRDNGGGSLSNIKPLFTRFITKETVPCYIMHKTGPGHNDFSKPYPIRYSPAKGHTIWTKPVAVLVNRSTFSAANTFASAMKMLPNVILVGARTGGGGGLPFNSELPNGWSVRFSASPVTDASCRPIEDGVEPSDGCAVTAPESELAAGKDAILEFALRRLGAGN